MDNNNKTNQGQNDLNKKPGVGTDKVANQGQGNPDQGKNLNKTPGQNQKIGQDDLGGQRVSNKPNLDRQDDVQSDIDKGNKQRPNIDRDSQK